MFCLKCGKPIKGDSKFCRYCGEELPEMDKKKIEKIESDQKKQEGLKKIEYAGFWLRVVAGIIDIIVFMALTVIAGGILGLILGATGNLDVIDQLPDEFYQIFSMTVAWLYYASLESSKKQATIGHLALKLKVTDENNKRISFLRATGRHFSKILSGLIFSIGFLMIAFTKKKQGLHDIIAKCLVVKK